MKYKRTDGIGVESEVAVNDIFKILGALAGNVEYEVAVAGQTIKGMGPYSPKITVTTSEDGKTM